MNMAKAIIGCFRITWLFSIVCFGGSTAVFGQGLQIDAWLAKVNRGLTQAERWLEASQRWKESPSVDEPSRLEADWRAETSAEKRLDLLASRLLKEEYRPYDAERRGTSDRRLPPVISSPSDLVHGRSSIESPPWRPIRLKLALEPWIREIEIGLRPMLAAVADWRRSAEAEWAAQALAAWTGPLSRWQGWLDSTRAQATDRTERQFAGQGSVGLGEMQQIFGRTIVGRPIETEWSSWPQEACEQWSELKALAMRGYEVPRSSWYALGSYPQERSWRDAVSQDRERFPVR
jgi:hypothetical protein